MAIIKRFKRLLGVQSKEITAQGIGELLEKLGELKLHCAKAIADQHRSREAAKQALTQSQLWKTKRDMALKKNDEELAAAYLRMQESWEKEFTRRDEIAKIDETIATKLHNDLHRIEELITILGHKIKVSERIAHLKNILPDNDTNIQHDEFLIQTYNELMNANTFINQKFRCLEDEQQADSHKSQVHEFKTTSPQNEQVVQESSVKLDRDVPNKIATYIQQEDKEKQKTIFISYSRSDHTVVSSIYRKLKGKYNVWMDQVELHGGENWELQITKQIKASNKVLVFLSNTALSKVGYFQAELKKIQSLGDNFPEEKVWLIPIKLDNCEVPTFIEKIHYLEYFSMDKERFFELLEKSISL